jgi:hypothetical protein
MSQQIPNDPSELFHGRRDNLRLKVEYVIPLPDAQG